MNVFKIRHCSTTYYVGAETEEDAAERWWRWYVDQPMPVLKEGEIRHDVFTVSLSDPQVNAFVWKARNLPDPSLELRR